MPAAADVLSVLHLLLLSTFVGGTSVAMLVALINRLRVTRPVLAWRTGPVTGLPLTPLLFLALAVGGLSGATWMGQSVPPSVWIGYPAGGLFWFAAAWLARSIVVTEYGIIHDVNRLHRAVAWSQIVDYVETTRRNRPHFVFLYRDDDGARSRRDLPVAEAQADAFRTLVQQKLDARLQLSPGQALDEETLDELGRP